MSIFEPARKLRKEVKGYDFKADGVLIVRVSSFGCAVIDKRGRTHSFLDDVQGRWKLLANGRIQMTYETFMGNYEEEALLADGQLRVISVRAMPSTE
jgi:hypothetical protein